MKTKFSTYTGVVFPDVHLAPADEHGRKPMDRHDPVALSIAFQLLADLKPDFFCQVGDLDHLGFLSHWNRDKDMQGRAVALDGETISMNLKRDHELCNVFWDMVQEICGRNVEYHQLEGNHEEILRALRYRKSMDGLDMSQCFPEKAWNLDQRKVAWTPYQRYDGKKNWVTFHNKLKIIHGKFASVNHLDLHWRDMGCGNVMYGHIHTRAVRDYVHPEYCTTAESIGCLCTRNASYHRGRNNGWAQDVSVLHGYTDGKYVSEFVRILNGRAYYNGKTYVAKALKGLM